jgi:folate-binding protein YgfZ
MNSDWKNFLVTKYETLITNDGVDFLASDKTNKRIYAITDLGLITVAGNDAATFLQGQITCNVHDINDNKSSLGAICNPKGRVITTFLLVKQYDVYLLVLPLELLPAVKKRLQMYVLRSAITLTDSTDELCLIGCCDADAPANASQQLGNTTRQNNSLTVDLSRKINRQLLITDPEDAKQFWTEQVSQQGYQPAGSKAWHALDIADGIPWLTADTSEEFIPQMLNLDTLGGISLTKGCYTGQEIVARTHYLGKAKRQMFVAECELTDLPAVNASIVDDSSGVEQAAGNVLMAQIGQGKCKMLVVLQVSETQTYNLKLNGKDLRLL